MTSQEFAVLDVLRLQVQDGWPDLENQILNPSGEGGAWGWSYSWIGTEPRLSAGVTGAGLPFMQARAVAGTDEMTPYVSIPLPAPSVAGMQLRAMVDVTLLEGGWAGAEWLVRMQDIEAPGFTEEVFPDPIAVGINELPAVDIPVGSTHVSLMLGGTFGALSDGDRIRWRETWLVIGDAADVAATDPLAEPPWVDVLGSAASIEVEREDLNVGVLSATLYDSTLDPASTDLIRPGKRCRLDVLTGGDWEHLFTGKLENPSSAYEVRDPNRSDLRRVQIRLVASDPAADLANEPRRSGVATIPELPAVLLGTEVPWNLNGSSDAIDPASVVTVARNDQASALDQVAITRDSVLGFAWVDRSGVLQAWDRDVLGTTVAIELDEEHYSDASIDFDVDRTFNTLEIELLRINPGTGETETITFGPYVDQAARRQWRARKATFKVQGLTEAEIPDYAASILALNATPVKRINSVTLPLRTVAELEQRATLDLYDLVSLSNDRAGVSGQTSRITSMKHRIVIKREGGRLVNRWWLELGFSTDENVASPQVTPSPTPGGGKTLGELLRPVGEVTMWYGAKEAIPAGWLPMDGTAFDGDQYPALAELLGGEVLPNMTDRFPIGAGTKALGTSGGAVVTDPPTDTAVGWSVPNTGGSSSPRLSEHNAHVHDAIPPWRSVWFIIRAA